MWILVAFSVLNPEVYGAMPVPYYSQEHCESRIEFIQKSPDSGAFTYKCFKVKEEN